MRVGLQPIALAFVIVASSPVWAEEYPPAAASVPRVHEPAVEPLVSKRYAQLMFEDLSAVLSSPLRWKAKAWALFGIDAAAVIGTAAVLDRPVQKTNERHRTKAMTVIAHVFDPLGNECALVVPGGFYLAGVLRRHDKEKAVAQDSLAATFVEAGVVAPMLKLAIGRGLPKDSGGAFHFRPFSGKGVFPSGHTGEAFTLAAVVSAHYDQTWVKGTVYGVAGMVGISRIVDNAHYASDVLAGAMIGTAIGRAVACFNQQQRLQVVPLVEDQAKGVQFVYAF